MPKLLSRALVGASLMFVGGAALADGYYGGGRGYEPSFSWTGFYLGANVGYAWDADHPSRIVTTNIGTSTAPFDTPSANGGFFGVHAGYNYQFGRIVLGVEADAEAPMPGLIHADNCGVVLGGQCGVLVGANFIQAEKQQDYFGTVRGRVGVAFDRVLVYGSGGFAYGSIHDHLLVNGVAKSSARWHPHRICSRGWHRIRAQSQPVGEA
jgi:outer membrane immunogenic protein